MCIRDRLYSYDGEPLVFSVHSGSSFSEKLRITSTGKVGINSTSPSHTLDVVGGYQALGLYRNDFTGNSGAGIQLNFGRANATGHLFNAALITAVGSDNTAQAAELRFSGFWVWFLFRQLFQFFGQQLLKFLPGALKKSY